MDVSRICADLVAIKSENPPGNTADAIEYIRCFLEGLGIRSTVTGRDTGYCNLVTRGTGSDLLLCGHVDVVPALDEGWKYPPFSGKTEEGYVWGRGATDMKGGCAAILAACSETIDRVSHLPATLAFVCDEETGGEKGILKLLSDNLISPCDCLIAEPSPMRHPSIGQKGLCRLEMKFSGTPAHGSLYPAVGTSAIMAAVSFLSRIKTLHDRDYPAEEWTRKIIGMSSEVLGKEFDIPGVSRILKKITFNPGIIRGGEKSNVVAQQCCLDLELRIPWGCSIPELISEISGFAEHGTILSCSTQEPSMTDPSSRIVAITCTEVRKVCGGDVSPIVQWAASDARHLRNAGFRVLEYGPGEIPTLHAVNERVAIKSLENATLIYQGIMNAYKIKPG